MANAVNEALIRDVIEDVLGRLGGSPEIVTAAPAAKPVGNKFMTEPCPYFINL